MAIKITERDKKLLVFLGVFLILVAFTVLVFLPAYDHLAQMDLEKQQLEMTQDEMDMVIATGPANEQAMAGVDQQYDDISNRYFQPMESQDIDRELTTLVLSRSLAITSMNITMETTPTSLNTYAVSETDSEEATTEEETASAVTCAHVSLNVQGNSNNIQSLLDYFGQQDQPMRLVSVSYSSMDTGATTQDNQGSAARIDVDVYMLDYVSQS